MAKHPVPKKKMSNARTAKRYAAFATKKRRYIENFVNLTLCKSCGNAKLNHQACSSCGIYRDRSVNNADKIVDKVTKIKA